MDRVDADTTLVPKEGLAQRAIYAISLVVCAVVAFLILGPRPDGVAGAVDVSALPWVNAGINSVTTLVLIAGFVAIRLKQVGVHRVLMTTALGLSAVFLVVYIVYHWFSTGPVRYQGDYRAIYLFVLATHVVLAAGILPLALTTWFRGWSGAIARHRRIAPLTLGLWLYVTLTGVMIVTMAHG